MTNFKAISSTTTTATSFTEALAQVNNALSEIEQFREENGEALTLEQSTDMARIETMLKAEKAAMEATGVNGGAANASVDLPEVLPGGWNGITPDDISMIEGDQAYTDANYDIYGEYMGSITVPNSGVADDPTKVAFQMTEDMQAVYAESHGNDIIITAVMNDGSRQSWVIKDGTVRNEPIYISGMGLSHGVTIDASRVYRTNGTVYVWGSENDDILIGSQSADKIVGLAGVDTIEGLAGNDAIWGDEYYGKDGKSGDFNKNYGGNDDINGGVGQDTIFAGGGSDTVYSTDATEAVYEYEGMIDDAAAQYPEDISTFIAGTSGDWQQTVDDEGVITLENTTGVGGTIDLQMPEGYTMASANFDSEGNMIITFVGDEGSFKIKIKDCANFQSATGGPDSLLRLNFTGSEENDIIDFSNIEVTNGGLLINLKSGGGDDIILGAKNKIFADGVDITKLTKSQGSSVNINKLVTEDGIFVTTGEDDDDNVTTNNGYQATYNADSGQVEITKTGESTDPNLGIKAPAGFTTGYIAEDDENYYVVLVKPATATEKAETIVVKVSKDLVTPDKIIVQQQDTTTNDSKTVSYMTPIDLMPVSLDDTDYLTDGGDGADLMFYQKGSNVEKDDDDSTTEI